MMKRPAFLTVNSNEMLPAGKKPGRFNIIVILLALVAVYGFVMMLSGTEVSQPTAARHGLASMVAPSAADSVTIFNNRQVNLDKQSVKSAQPPVHKSGEIHYSQYVMRAVAFIILLAAGVWWGTRWLKTRKGITGQAPLNMEVMGRRYLGPKQSVVAVKVGEKVMLLGVTEQNIGLLTTLAEDDPALEAGEDASGAESPRQFAELVQQVTRKYQV